MGKICTFFGHRDTLSDIKPARENAIRRLITQENVDTFWIGGHGNFDKFAAQILQECKKEFPHIQLVLMAAYVQQLNQEDNISYDAFDYPIDAQIAQHKFAIAAHNHYMAKYSNFVIANVCREYGGAYDALKIARAHYTTTINLASD